MRMYLAAIGSRGDFEPFRSLAIAASKSGHDVHLAHSQDFATDESVPYTSHHLPGSFEELLSEGFSFTKSLAQYRTVIEPMLRGIYSTSTSHITSLKPDVVVYHPKVITAAAAAHAVDALAARAELVPTLTPTRDFPAAGLPVRLHHRLNRFSFSLVAAGLSSFGNPAKKLGKELGVANLEPDISLCPVSRVLIPQPEDWPPSATITGPWLTSTKAPQDTELEAFLDRGPTVYIGFGSMNDGEASARSRAATILAATRTLGYQTLFVTGWGGVSVTESDASSPDVLVRPSVHHESVFPRVIAAIHHGGAGTTQRSLLAGAPTIIMPFLADQPWWAQRLYDQGLGPPALNKNPTRAELVSAAIADAVSRLDTIKAVSRNMAAEDGVGHAIQLLEGAAPKAQSHGNS